MAMSPLDRPQSVFTLQKELSREGERRYTKLSMAEKMRMQLDSFVSDVKKTTPSKPSVAAASGARPK